MNRLSEALEAIVAFRDQRDWAQFHTPRQLAAALGIEVAELQETMLWKTDEEVDALLTESSAKAEIEQELADVLIFALLLCHEARVDPGEAIARKLELNAKKYPIELAKGTATKYNRRGSAPEPPRE